MTSNVSHARLPAIHGHFIYQQTTPTGILTPSSQSAGNRITGAGQAKINRLGPNGDPELVWSVGIKSSDMRRLFAVVGERREALLKEWERIHGQLD
jgi:hypothetical protein